MIQIVSPAVRRVFDYALHLGVPPEIHLARWVEASALVKKGKDPEDVRGMVKSVEIIREGETVVGVKAYV